MEFIDLKKQYLALKEEIDLNIKSVLSVGAYIGGEEVGRLAKELASFCGVKYCLPCANGTDALTLALRCLEIDENDVVFVPSFTFFATAEVVGIARAKIVFVDVDERTFNISCKKLEEAIEQVKREGKYKPRAIITVDLFGLPADYTKIRAVADKNKMLIIEDAAQGFGGRIGEKKACSFGDISTTSFFPAKPLGCYGDGGAIFTDNKEYYEIMKSLAVHGKGSDKYDNVKIGYNSRLDTLQAAILLPKLKAFVDYEYGERQVVANRYTKALSKHYVTPLIEQGFLSSWAQYTLILSCEDERQKLQEYLRAEGIPSMIYYPIPMHKQKVFSGYSFNNDKLQVSEMLAKRVLSIPMHPYLDEAEQDFIIKRLLDFTKEGGENGKKK